MKKYFLFLKILIEHKLIMMKICFSNKKYVMGLTHDLGRFNPKYFISVAKGTEEERCRVHDNYMKKQGYNWENYTFKDSSPCLDMSEKHIEEMIYDWMATIEQSNKRYNWNYTVEQYYISFYHDFKFSHKTRIRVEKKLNLLTPNLYNKFGEYFTLEQVAKKLGETEFRKEMKTRESWFNIHNIYEAVYKKSNYKF